MKKPLAYLLVFVYVFALLKPLSPLVNDVISHTFWKMEHLATVHFENGTYHLHEDLRQAADKEDTKAPQNTGSQSKIDESLSAHFSDNKTIRFAFTLSDSEFIPSVTEDTVSAFLTITAPPPQA